MPIPDILEAREALSESSAVSGFIMDSRLNSDKEPGIGRFKSKKEPQFKNIFDVQRFLHQEQGFGSVVTGRN